MPSGQVVRVAKPQSRVQSASGAHCTRHSGEPEHDTMQEPVQVTSHDVASLQLTEPPVPTVAEQA
jgi:hypothetical protein